jgi:hypothetical protein
MMSCVGKETLSVGLRFGVIRKFIVLFSVFMAAATGMAQAGASPAERALLQMANQFRAEHGVAPLAWNSALARAARVHARRIAAEPGDLEHQYPGEADVIARASREGAHFAAIAENLAGRGQNPAQLHQGWMNSPVHRANLLNPKMNAVGIGVVERQGLLYAVEDFAQAVSAPRQTVVESQVMAALQKVGMTSVRMTKAARSNCESQSNTAEGAQLVVHWEGPNPGQLPEALVQQMSRAAYHSAAVGACPGSRPGQGFTTYRVAVLLY